MVDLIMFALISCSTRFPVATAGTRGISRTGALVPGLVRCTVKAPALLTLNMGQNFRQTCYSTSSASLLREGGKAAN